MVEIKKRYKARFKITLEDRKGTSGARMRSLVFDDGKHINNVDDLHRSVEECIKKL